MTPSRGALAPITVFAAAAVITACFVQQPPPAGPPNYQGQEQGQEQPPYDQDSEPYGPTDDQGYATPPSAGLRNGQYFCSFQVGQYSYPNFACIVYARRDGQQVLEKLSGSQRIHGVVTPNDAGFDFRGTFFCPYGSCTEDVSARFASLGRDVYQGTLSKQTSGQITVRMRFLPTGFPRGYGGYGYAARRGYGAASGIRER